MTRHAMDSTAAVLDRPHGPMTQARTSSSLAWHTLPVDAVGRTFATTTSRLSADEAAFRLDSYGPTELRHRGHRVVRHRIRAMASGTLGTFALGLNDGVLVTTLALTIVPVLELVKWMARHEWCGELV